MTKVLFRAYRVLLLLAVPFAAQAQTGRVGIGTTTPTKTLDVNGDVRVRGLNGAGNRLPLVQPDGTLGVNAPVFSTAPTTAVPAGAAGSVGTGDVPTCVAVSGTKAYVVGFGSNTLQIFDVATSNAPTLLGTVATGDFPSSVAVSGTTAYVVNARSNTLQVFDVAAPNAPVLLGSIGTGTNPSSVAVSGTTAYVVNAVSNTLQVFDVAAPNAPALLGSIGTGTSPRSVAVSGTTAYVVNFDSNTLQLFNVATPNAPVLLGSVGTGAGPQSVAVSGTTAYVVNASSNTLQLFDVATPNAPVLLGSVGTGMPPRSVAVSGTTAYVVSYSNSTLQLFNVATPNAPALLGSAPTGTNPTSVAVSGTTAYVVNASSNTLQVFPAYTRVVAVNLDGSFGSVALPMETLANNGIQKVVNTFGLGGALNQPTTLAAGSNSFAITQDSRALGAPAVDINTISAYKGTPTYGVCTLNFSPGVTGIMTQLELSLSGSTHSVLIKVLDANGAVLMATNQTALLGGTTGVPQTIAFEVSVALIAGQPYSLVVDLGTGSFIGWTNRSGIGFYYRTTMRPYGAMVANQPLFTMAGGFVGINTATPNYHLDVNGAMRCISLTQTSDARLKQNIRPVGQALAGVLALHGVRYTFRRAEFPTKKLPDGEQLGFLAQEVETIYPELVSTDASGYKAVNYAQLTPVLLEAIKEQQHQIEQLKAANAALQSESTVLKGRAAATEAGAAADHADLQTMKQQLARLLGETAPAGAQARK